MKVYLFMSDDGERAQVREAFADKANADALLAKHNARCQEFKIWQEQFWEGCRQAELTLMKSLGYPNSGYSVYKSLPIEHREQLEALRDANRAAYQAEAKRVVLPYFDPGDSYWVDEMEVTE
jgi:hypothetical protein